MKLPARMSRRDVAMVVLVLVTVVLFVVCAYLAATNF
jgi:hypothetical protein